MSDDKVWLFNANLAWELFSSAIYNYRLSFNARKNHQRHAFYKNVILNAVTAVDAYANEVLAREKKWSVRKIKDCNDPLKELGVNFQDSDFKDSKFIRNNFIVHHKRNDYRYFIEINEVAALEAIESSQAIIAEVSYIRNRIFPYWITGLNFINPSDGNDICLLNDYEFWNRFKILGVIRSVNDEMVSDTGNISPPMDKETYDRLYITIWNEVKKSNFKLKILDHLKNKRFPFMPFLTSEWWMIDPPLTFQEEDES